VLLLLPVFIIVFPFLITGCAIPGMQVQDTSGSEITSAESSTQSPEDEKTEDNDNTDENTETKDSSGQEVDSNDDVDNQEEESKDEEPGLGEVTTNVYYANQTAEYLIAETRVVSEENKYVDAIYEMMKEPTDDNLVRLIPDTTEVNSIVVENGIAKLDLSNDFIEDRFKSDVVDLLLIFSVVNTLTEFDEISSVDFYIDGQKLDLIGMLDITDPQFRRSDLIKQE
jgi:spore germination protein GerM